MAMQSFPCPPYFASDARHFCAETTDGDMAGKCVGTLKYLQGDFCYEKESRRWKIDGILEGGKRCKLFVPQLGNVTGAIEV